LAIVLYGAILTVRTAEEEAARGFFTGLVKSQIMERERKKSTSQDRRKNQLPFSSIFPKALEKSENFDHFFEYLSSTKSNNSTFESILTYNHIYKTLAHPCWKRLIDELEIIVEILSQPKDLIQAFELIAGSNNTGLNNCKPYSLHFLPPLLGIVVGAKGLKTKQLAKLAGIKNKKIQETFRIKLNEFLKISKFKKYQLAKINKKTLEAFIEHSKKAEEHHKTQPYSQSTEVSSSEKIEASASEESDFQIRQPTDNEKEKEAIDTGLNKFFKFVKSKKSVTMLTIISILCFYYHFYRPHSLSLPYFS